MDTFFANENQATPLLLPLEGKIRPSAKSDLLHCLELCEKQLLHAPNIDAIILDDAAVVHMERQELFKIMQTQCLVHIYCLSYRMPIELTLFGMYIWKIV